MIELNHKKLDVWKLSLELTAIIYKLTSTFPSFEMHGLASQLRRAAVSISSNIAEGAARSSEKERVRFFEISRSSLVEVDSQLEIAMKLEYVSSEEIEQLDELLNHLFAKLSNVIKKSKIANAG